MVVSIRTLDLNIIRRAGPAGRSAEFGPVNVNILTRRQRSRGVWPRGRPGPGDRLRNGAAGDGGLPVVRAAREQRDETRQGVLPGAEVDRRHAAAVPLRAAGHRRHLRLPDRLQQGHQTSLRL